MDPAPQVPEQVGGDAQGKAEEKVENVDNKAAGDVDGGQNDTPNKTHAADTAGKKSVVADENQSQQAQELKQALENKISVLSEGKGEDEKTLARLYKKAQKDLKEQLEGLGDNSAEKIKMLQQKLLEKTHEANKIDRAHTSTKRALENAQKDKDNALKELNRTNAVKKKLEDLCKELQKHNKSVIEESKSQSMKDSDKRKELSEKFSETIKDVQAKMELQDNERNKMSTENDHLREQLTNFLSQYEVRDKHFEQQLHAKGLEIQLAEAKLAQSEKLCEHAIAQAEAYKQQATELAMAERAQREQTALYSEKFKEFQDTLSKSNEVFASFKKESDKMQKKLKSLEKERREAVTRAEKAEAHISTVEALKKELSGVKKQKERMEGLCRTLSQERQTLREKLKLECPEDDASAMLKEAAKKEEEATEAAATEATEAAPTVEATSAEATVSSQ